jgi:predicted DNA-binding protein (UPF0251 family)
MFSQSVNDPTQSLSEAQKMLQVSRTTLWRVLRKYGVEVVEDVLDARIKRVRVTDLRRIQADAERVRKGLTI